MVVSIEISGPYEEKLRRLVELGVYASVAEAVRDAIRKLMKEIDMRKIALQLYTKKGTSLYYYCDISEQPCNTAIEYLLSQQVAPRLGQDPQEELYNPTSNDNIILDPSSILVIYNSLVSQIIEILSNKYRFYISEELVPLIEIYYALSARLGIRTRFVPRRVPVKSQKPPSNIYITKIENGIIKFAKKENFILLVDDMYTREWAQKQGVKTTTTLNLILNNSQEIDKNLLKEIIFSLKLVPYFVPSHIEEVITK